MMTTAQLLLAVLLLAAVLVSPVSAKFTPLHDLDGLTKSQWTSDDGRFHKTQFRHDLEDGHFVTLNYDAEMGDETSMVHLEQHAIRSVKCHADGTLVVDHDIQQYRDVFQEGFLVNGGFRHTCNFHPGVIDHDNHRMEEPILREIQDITFRGDNRVILHTTAAHHSQFFKNLQMSFAVSQVGLPSLYSNFDCYFALINSLQKHLSLSLSLSAVHSHILLTTTNNDNDNNNNNTNHHYSCQSRRFTTATTACRRMAAASPCPRPACCTSTA
jgi:hypothetical protein